MSFDLNYWLKETIRIISLASGCYFQDRRPRIVCNDGYSVSVQADQYTYCTPRYTQWQNENGWQVMSIKNNFETDRYTPYESVELGFPSEADELINSFAEGDDYTNTVYGYVPVKIVEQLIEKHGGFKGVDYSNTEGGSK